MLVPFLAEREIGESGSASSHCLELGRSRAFFRLRRWRFPGLKVLLFVLADVNPVSLQLDLDRRFQLQDIMMDFKVRFLGWHGVGEGTLGDAS